METSMEVGLDGMLCTATTRWTAKVQVCLGGMDDIGKEGKGGQGLLPE